MDLSREGHGGVEAGRDMRGISSLLAWCMRLVAHDAARPQSDGLLLVLMLLLLPPCVCVPCAQGASA